MPMGSASGCRDDQRLSALALPASAASRSRFPGNWDIHSFNWGQFFFAAFAANAATKSPANSLDSIQKAYQKNHGENAPAVQQAMEQLAMAGGIDGPDALEILEALDDQFNLQPALKEGMEARNMEFGSSFQNPLRMARAGRRGGRPQRDSIGGRDVCAQRKARGAGRIQAPLNFIARLGGSG
jgi:hypothetical protein